jgi:hypothetical protein
MFQGCRKFPDYVSLHPGYGTLDSSPSSAPGVPFLLVTFLWASKDKFIRNEFVLQSRPEGQITRM